MVQPVTPPKFSSLPTEIGLEVFSYLSIKQLYAYQHVSRQFKALSDIKLHDLRSALSRQMWKELHHLAIQLGFQKVGELVQLIYDSPAFWLAKPSTYDGTLAYGFHCLKDARRARPNLTKEEVKAILELKVLNEPWEKLTLDNFVDPRQWLLIRDGKSIKNLMDLVNKNYLLRWLLCVEDKWLNIRGITYFERTIPYLLSKGCFQTVFDFLTDPEITFDVKECVYYRHSFLHWAASSDCVEDVFDQKDLTLTEEDKTLCIQIVACLIKRGVDVNQADSGCTPLFYAAASGRDHIVAHLLKQNALPNVGAEGCKPLQIAIERSYFKIAQYLLQHGATYQDWYFLFYNRSAQDIIIDACRRGDPDAQATAQILIEQGKIKISPSQAAIYLSAPKSATKSISLTGMKTAATGFILSLVRLLTSILQTAGQYIVGFIEWIGAILAAIGSSFSSTPSVLSLLRLS